MRTHRLFAAVAIVLLAAACSSADTPSPHTRTASVVKGAACPAGGRPASGAALLPDLTLPCLGGGRKVSLRSLTGKPMVLNLWATWCPGCREEMPILQRFAAAAGSKVRVLGVDTLDPEQGDALSYLDDARVRYPSLYDSGRKTLTALGVPGMPASVFVRPDGSVAKVHPAPMTFQQLRRAAAQYLDVDVAG